MTANPFIRDIWFDDVTTRAMGAAIDKARVTLNYFGVATTARTFVAERILRAAHAGERNPARLYEVALEELGIDAASSPIAA